jgi:hypothetical protein
VRDPGAWLAAPALRRVRPRQAAGMQLVKRRGFCPSCGARRMSRTAAHLVDHIIAQVPVRQWVLSLPIPLGDRNRPPKARQGQQAPWAGRLHGAKAPFRTHPGMNAAGLRAAAGRDPGLDPGL